MLTLEEYEEEFEEKALSSLLPTLGDNKRKDSEKASSNVPQRKWKLRLERTSDIPYNDVLFNNNDKEKYFIYRPSGGLNNQRIEFEAALMFAKTFNRGLIVPMAGRHSSLREYLSLSLSDLIAMDLIFDFRSIASGEFQNVRIVPLNMTFSGFLAQLRLKFPHSCDFKFARLASKNRNGNHFCATSDFINKGLSSTKRFLVYDGHFYCHYFKKKRHEEVSSHMLYHPTLRALSVVLLQNLLNNRTQQQLSLYRHIPKFNAIHVRLGDYAKVSGPFVENDYIYSMKKAEFGKRVPVYVASDETMASKSLKRLGKAYHLLFFNDLDSYLVGAFMNTFSDKTVHSAMDLFGVVEQLMCARSNKFHGFALSTFTKHIQFMKEHMNLSIPESQWELETENKGSLVKVEVSHIGMRK